MKRVAIVYTVKSVLDTFETKLRSAVPHIPLKVYHIFDSFLATDPNPLETGYFTKNNKKRLFNDIYNAELTGADVIVVTCSTLTPTVMQIRPFIETPIVCIDDAMAEEAVRAGSKIRVMATAKSTLEPTTSLLYAVAKKQGKQIEVEAEDNPPAFAALQSGDMKQHDQLVLQQAKQIHSCDVIVLAQASMAHLEADVEQLCHCKVFSSPDRCIAQVKQILEEKE